MAKATRGRGARLRKTWSAMTLLSPTALSTTQSVLGSVSIASGSALEATVLRCRGQLLCFAIPDASTDSAVLGLGLIVVTASALAVGGVSVPGPLEDQESDSWLWHQYIPFDAIAANAGIDRLGSLVARVDVDAKAMRKVPGDSAVVLMGQLNTSTMASVQVTGGIRMLFGS